VKKPIKEPLKDVILKDVLIKAPPASNPSLAELSKQVQVLTAEVEALRRELRARK